MVSISRLTNQEDKESGVSLDTSGGATPRPPRGTIVDRELSKRSDSFLRLEQYLHAVTGDRILVERELRTRVGTAALVAAALVLAACSDAPLGSLGQRSSDWVGEPTVITTSTIPTTVPVVVDARVLTWFNDQLGGQFLDDPEALKTAVFARRGGDLFIQASRDEIVALLPEIKFPSSTPYLSEYVTSQLVFDERGDLASDPVAAFGIWSSEPYTRSRSVAQMIVISVSIDPETAAEVAAAGADNSCERYADRSNEVCAVTTVSGRPVWSLEAANGTTMIWFDEQYRYELFGRSYVTADALQRMVLEPVPLSELEVTAG